MKQINSYLTFSGDCREAMIFYKNCLGGELEFLTVGNSPMAEQMPPRMKECILHSTLKTDAFVLMGTDMVPESGRIKGNTVSQMIECSSEKEIRIVYKKLAAGGKPEHPLEDTFWGALFGGLTDKFGNHWMLNYDRKQGA
jgi:PhnB protein